MIIGAVDIGTNSCRLLIARYEQNKVRPVFSDLEITRIGEGLGKNNYIKKEPLIRTLNCLKRFMEKCQEYNSDLIRITATSAVRDAKNKEMVAEEVWQTTGINLEVLSGEKEAYLSYLGAVSDLSTEDKAQVVLDIGGGSTELIYPSLNSISYNSINLGAVRLAEKPELQNDFPQLFSGLFKDQLPEKFNLIGVGGTITSLVAIKLKLNEYDPELVHGQILTLKEIREMKEMLFNLSLEERQRLPGLQPQRADIIPYGTLILEELIQRMNCSQILVSEKDILYGIIITGASLYYKK